MNNPNLKRVAFSPGEFAALFGKSQTWGYRQIYAGQVKTIATHGRILIPAAEVERILETAGIYDGIKPKPKPAKSKRDLQELAPELTGAWGQYLQRCRISGTQRPASSTNSATVPTKKSSPTGGGRKAAMERIFGKRNNPARQA